MEDNKDFSVLFERLKEGKVVFIVPKNNISSFVELLQNTEEFRCAPSILDFEDTVLFFKSMDEEEQYDVLVGRVYDIHECSSTSNKYEEMFRDAEYIVY